MFEWIGFAGRLASGDASPLDAVAALAELSNRALLEQDQDEALAVIEITQAHWPRSGRSRRSRSRPSPDVSRKTSTWSVPTPGPAAW